ncbi:hypothetical protein ONZ45_g10620 [Pleurotus djamor]|nr:hypothetical protein ONZ45_g10620 [Pleurotus djamor]
MFDDKKPKPGEHLLLLVSTMDVDSPWEDNPTLEPHGDAEWSKLSSDFTNVGYREGITAGKEAALQEGFDDGFANVGVPLGRELGLLRGLASALLSFVSDSADNAEQDRSTALISAKEIVSGLGQVRFADIVPRDLEAEQHAREHLDAEGEALDTNEELQEKRDMEGLEDLLAGMSASGN